MGTGQIRLQVVHTVRTPSMDLNFPQSHFPFHSQADVKADAVVCLEKKCCSPRPGLDRQVSFDLSDDLAEAEAPLLHVHPHLREFLRATCPCGSLLMVDMTKTWRHICLDTFTECPSMGALVTLCGGYHGHHLSLTALSKTHQSLNITIC